jgi:hypothetical protein
MKKGRGARRVFFSFNYLSFFLNGKKMDNNFTLHFYLLFLFLIAILKLLI